MTYCLMNITSSHFIFSCLCIAMQLLVSFLYLYNACDILTSLSYTMRGWPFVVIELWVSAMLSLPCHYFRSVSFMLPFNTCISLGNCVITWPPDMLLFDKTLLLCHDLPGLLSISYHGWLLVEYHLLSCYHLTPSMIHLTLYNYYDNGNVVLDHLLCIPVMYSSYVFQLWSCSFP